MWDLQNLRCWGKQMSEPERRNPEVTLCYWIILIIGRGEGEDDEGVCRQQTE